MKIDPFLGVSSGGARRDIEDCDEDKKRQCLKKT